MPANHSITNVLSPKFCIRFLTSEMCPRKSRTLDVRWVHAVLRWAHAVIRYYKL